MTDKSAAPAAHGSKPRQFTIVPLSNVQPEGKAMSIENERGGSLSASSSAFVNGEPALA